MNLDNEMRTIANSNRSVVAIYSTMRKTQFTGDLSLAEPTDELAVTIICYNHCNKKSQNFPRKLNPSNGKD